jgi:hypothetical protein
MSVHFQQAWQITTGDQAMQSILGGIAATLVFASAAFAQQPKASQQLQKANESQRGANHTFDGRAAPPPAVRANPTPKPSVVGTPVTSTRTQTGFKPQPPSLKIKDPPPPKR